MTMSDEFFLTDGDESERRIKKLEARMKKLEKIIGDASRAGFAWAGHMVHGDAASVEDVRRLVIAAAPGGEGEVDRG